MARQKVYFIHSYSLGVKIGVSKDPWQRMRSLGLPGLRLMATIACPNARGFERQLHGCFAHLRRGRSEWFHPGPELMEYIDSVRG